MKNANFLIFFLIFNSLCVYSQVNEIYLTGIVTDKETALLIKDVNISIKGTSFGTTTDTTGYFRLKISQTPAIIEFTHVAYKELQIQVTVQTQQTVNIRMEPEPLSGQEIDIYAKNTAQKIINRNELVILDYELTPGFIVLIGHLPNCKPCIVYMNYDFDTVCFRELDETPEDIFKDCKGIIHLITEKNAYQVYYDTASINLLYPVSKNDFYETMPKCVAELDNMFYIRQYVLHSQIIHYYYFNAVDSSLNELTMIADEQAIFRIQDLLRLYYDTPERHFGNL
ncbi:MAG: carboxypeptidase-like regulatory domain-containing protein [Bacteroidia bacterium]|nr:carboxypeptidase-like regulatory domain-containing protein [Bacteroidia bacterium]